MVGISVAVVVLLGAVGMGMRGHGAELGTSVQAQLQRSVTDPGRGAGREPIRAPERARPAESSMLSAGRWRAVRERRVGGGSGARVSRDALRLTPALQPRSAWDQTWRRDGSRGGSSGNVEARSCLLCTALEWSHDLRSGASTGSDGRFAGGEGSFLAEARLALAAADAHAAGRTNLGPLTLDADGRVRAAVGGEATLGAVVRLGRDVQVLEAEAGTMLGASAKAEGRVGASLLGVALEQAGQIEGWAGIGVRGEGGLRREGGRFSWNVGWGAALGVGGAARWSGSVDVSKFPDRARQVGTRTLRAGIDIARGG